MGICFHDFSSIQRAIGVPTETRSHQAPILEALLELLGPTGGPQGRAQRRELGAKRLRLLGESMGITVPWKNLVKGGPQELDGKGKSTKKDGWYGKNPWKIPV